MPEFSHEQFTVDSGKQTEGITYHILLATVGTGDLWEGVGALVSGCV